jgi:D-alanyl-D-alanine carboxypeptidase
MNPKLSFFHRRGLVLVVVALSSIVLTLTAAAAPKPTVPDSAVQQQRLQKLLNDLHEKNGFPGMTAAVVLPSGKVITAATGYADVESKTAMKPDDRMLAGSIGKTFFDAIFMRLAADGKLDLDQKISFWLKDESWFQRLPNANDITFKMLLNHTSGIPEHVESPEFVAALWKDPDKVWKPTELLAFSLDKPAKFAAGQGWSYADTNFILAAYIVEKITKRPLYEQIHDEILKPLKLNNTSPSTSRTLSGLVMGYSMPDSPFKFEGSTLVDCKLRFNPQMEWAGGGFISNSSDLARWADLLYTGKAFDKKMLPIMETAVPAKTGKGDEYGLGVQVRHTNYGITYGHGGWFPGYLSEMEYFPEHNTSIAVQFNTDNFGVVKMHPHKYVVAIADVLFQD